MMGHRELNFSGSNSQDGHPVAEQDAEQFLLAGSPRESLVQSL